VAEPPTVTFSSRLQRCTPRHEELNVKTVSSTRASKFKTIVLDPANEIEDHISPKMLGSRANRDLLSMEYRRFQQDVQFDVVAEWLRHVSAKYERFACA
jgi:hypothetical protein